MLASTFYSLHVEGGMTFMAPLSIIFLIIIGLLGFVIFSAVQKKSIQPIWLETIKQLGRLALAWGTFSTIIGLFEAFDAIEGSPDVVWGLPIICGGLKVAIITVLYGLIIYCISLLSYIILKFISTSKTA
ncbi:MAG: MotA/TolQ/ExbB proton channel family protein [Cyclobacteriaceae bacterium]|nr:MotA/TolQ/ExbB proton channel family protein [Cyclobacteriaceae bacterium]